MFARTSSNPQNLHYDTVKFQELACEDIVPSKSRQQKIYLRHWFPIVNSKFAPLLLSNTTHLYDNACSRRFADSRENQSPSWLIPQKDEFLEHCKERQEVDEAFSGTCAWYHTLNMYPGEYVSFRNGMVLHGSAPVGALREEEDESLRLTFVVDCEYSSLYSS